MESTQGTLKQLYDRVLTAQGNVKTALANIDIWANQSLFERKEGKKENLLQMDDYEERIQKRYDLVKQSARELQAIVDNNYKLFANIPLEVEAKTEEVRLYSRCNSFYVCLF